jgi:hypothetical protein
MVNHDLCAMRTYFPIEQSMREGITEEFLKKGLDFTEEAMIRVLEDDRFDHALKWKAAIGLRDRGTRQCIPALEHAIGYPNEDVKTCAILTIAHLADQPETDFLAALLDRKRLRKGPVLQALDALDDAATIPAVLQYLSQTLKMDSRNSTIKNSDVMHGLFLLERHRSDHPQAQEILAGYKKLWNKFDALVQKELSTRTETFRGMYRFR